MLKLFYRNKPVTAGDVIVSKNNNPFIVHAMQPPLFPTEEGRIYVSYMDNESEESETIPFPPSHFNAKWITVFGGNE